MIVPRPEDAHMSEHHPGVDVIKRVLMLRGDIEEVALVSVRRHLESLESFVIRWV
jgi:hypothetical protein